MLPLSRRRAKKKKRLNTEIGDRLHGYTVSSYLTNHLRQLGPAIPPCVSAMNSGDANARKKTASSAAPLAGIAQVPLGVLLLSCRRRSRQQVLSRKSPRHVGNMFSSIKFVFPNLHKDRSTDLARMRRFLDFFAGLSVTCRRKVAALLKTCFNASFEQDTGWPNKNRTFLRYHIFAATTDIIMRFLPKCSETTVQQKTTSDNFFKQVLNILCVLRRIVIEHTKYMKQQTLTQRRVR